MLPCMTLMAHVVNFFALEALFATSWSTSYCAWYDVVAAIASAIGVFGAVKVGGLIECGAQILAYGCFPRRFGEEC
jgi:hypothetical protein